MAKQTALQQLTGALDTAAGRTHDLVGDAKSRARGLGRDARSRAKNLRKDARSRAKDLRKDARGLGKETRRRTSAARDALAGKRTHPWRWIMAAAAAGIGAGAAAVAYVQRLFVAREQARLADVEATVAEHATAAERAGSRMNGYPAGGPVATGTASVTTSPKPAASSDPTHRD